MTRIERATAQEVHDVALDMRQRDFDEFSALYPTDSRPALAKMMAERFGGREDVLCGSRDGVPICIGGFIQARPGVITLLFYATDAFDKIALTITRFAVRRLFPRYFAAGIHRIEAVALADYVSVHNWLETLGLSKETGPLLGYGKRGEPFIQFSVVRNAASD